MLKIHQIEIADFSDKIDYWEIKSILILKGLLSGLKQLLATESILKIMKNAFYFTLKALFVLKIFKFLSWLFGFVKKTAWLERLG